MYMYIPLLKLWINHGLNQSILCYVTVFPFWTNRRGMRQSGENFVYRTFFFLKRVFPVTFEYVFCSRSCQMSTEFLHRWEASQRKCEVETGRDTQEKPWQMSLTLALEDLTWYILKLCSPFPPFSQPTFKSKKQISEVESRIGILVWFLKIC